VATTGGRADAPLPLRMQVLARWLRHVLTSTLARDATCAAPSPSLASSALAAALSSLAAHLDSRFSPLFPELGCASWSASRCPTDGCVAPDLDLELVEHATSVARALHDGTDALRTHSRRLDAVRGLIVQDYVELIARHIVDGSSLCSFLRCLADAQAWQCEGSVAG
jgi:hypothetical protein